MKVNIEPIALEFQDTRFFLNLGSKSDKIVSDFSEGIQSIDVCTEWENDEPYFVLYNTYACNLSCPYCFHGNLRNTDKAFKPQYSFDDLYSFMLRNNIHNTEIRFFGGEPLTNKEWIYQCIEYLKLKNVNAKYNIFTNGISIDDELISFSIKKRIKYFVSVAGHNEDEKGRKHKKIIQNNIKKLLENNLICIGRAVYKPEEISLVELIEETMIPHLYMLSITLEWGSNFNLENACKHLIEFSDFYIKRIANYQFDMIGVHPFVGYIGKWLFGKCYDVNQCGSGKTLYSVSIDGKIYPCHCFNENKDFVSGDLGTGYTPLFANLNANTIKKCAKCDIKYICKYRCYADAYLRNGSVYKFDDKKCMFEKKVVSCSAYILYILIKEYPKQFKIFSQLLQKALKKDISH